MPPISADFPLDMRYVLLGKVITMDTDLSVVNKGAVYVNRDTIEAVQPAASPPPDGFKDCLKINTKGTIYPGLIELHNHLSYNILPAWKVPKKYGNREQWRGDPDYRKFISGPMRMLAKERTGYLAALVRYVECKCLLAGVTTSQGITLASNAGVIKYYRGIVRNVEKPDDPALPAAKTRTDDVDDAEDFLQKLQDDSFHRRCRLLHLSEGKDQFARKQFLNLRLASGEWAITNALGGIHAAGLLAEDFPVLKANGGAIVWSPLSNLLLYGDTAMIQAAKENGLLIGLGSDWSPSGSKNLLGELKIAKIFSDVNGKIFSDEELVMMVTINAARILKWDSLLGSIEAGKRADLIVSHGSQGSGYRRLLRSSESDITLVVINGVPRCGTAKLMEAFDVETERLKIGPQQEERVLYLRQTAGTAFVGTLTLQEARNRLRTGLQNLPDPPNFIEPPLADLEEGMQPEVFTLVLDNDGEIGQSLRPLSPMLAPPPVAAAALEDILVPMELDELTVADDPAKYFSMLANQTNLPDYVKDKLPGFYPRLVHEISRRAAL
ncbi:MAG: amidohydrolase family protein [Euryarchaeota archaeon]|nr:amidohydrolase family protein [Euryarchaeota archaeon]